MSPLDPSRLSGGRTVLLGAAVLLASIAAALGGDLAGGAVRALALVALLGAAAILLRRAPGPRPAGTVTVLERHALGRDSGIGVIAAGERRLVVAYGAAGVAVLAELSPAAEAGAR